MVFYIQYNKILIKSKWSIKMIEESTELEHSTSGPINQQMKHPA